LYKHVSCCAVEETCRATGAHEHCSDTGQRKKTLTAFQDNNMQPLPALSRPGRRRSAAPLHITTMLYKPQPTPAHIHCINNLLTR
jgi:hypothetical protein